MRRLRPHSGVFAPGIDRRLEEIGVVHSRDFDGILEAEEESLTGTLLGVEFQQVDSLVSDGSGGHLIVLVTCNHLGESALAGAVRPHDRVDFARFDGKRQPVEDRRIADAGTEIFDFYFAHRMFLNQRHLRG